MGLNKEERYAFPWGINIGDVNNDTFTTLLLLPTQQGGVVVLYEDNIEQKANQFVENMVLHLLHLFSIGHIQANIIDYSLKKRFSYLSTLKSAQMYEIAMSSSDAHNMFNEIEKVARYRHHELLTEQTPTVSDFNRKNQKFKEKFYLLVINLEHYPDDMAPVKRLEEFFESAFEAGFFVIAFGSSNIQHSQHEIVQSFLKTYAKIVINSKGMELPKEYLNFSSWLKKSTFSSLQDEREKMVSRVTQTIEDEQNKAEAKEFLSLPIGTTPDGRTVINFSLGDKSKAYHAFITGVAGSGKTTIMNNIIASIARDYSADDIRLYLMDYKDGVEFQVFQNHPNCEKIFLDNEDLQAANDLLEEFVSIMAERAKRFKEHGVKDINQYNSVGVTPMYRLILVIDEVHDLFSGNFKQKEHFSKLLNFRT
jgi:hypothetical protein